jgi:hypothetical protein
MHVFYKITSLWLGLVITQSGCGPQGQMTRSIHPPTNLSARQGQDHSGKAATMPPRTRPGLPTRCRLEARVKDMFCISCDEGGADIERCYAFRGIFDDVKNCVYSAEHIKCLNVARHFALNIAIKGSLEKSLVENTRLWQNSLRAIATNQLSTELQGDLEEGLKKTEDLVRILVKAGKDPKWVDQEFPEFAPPLKKALKQLQHDKESGQLKLIQVLEVSRLMLEASGTSAILLPYWEALSVEGLEEPGQ